MALCKGFFNRSSDGAGPRQSNAAGYNAVVFDVKVVLVVYFIHNVVLDICPIVYYENDAAG